MRRIIVFSVLVFLACVSAFAEPGAKRDERRARKDSIKVAEMVGAHRKGTKIKLDGTVLTKEQQALLLSNIDSVDYNDDWAAFKKQRHLGNGLAIGGSVFIGAGAACEVVSLGVVVVGAFAVILTGGQGNYDDIFNLAGYWAVGGLASAAVGAGALAVGIPIRVKADKKMKATCEGYNNATVRVEKEVILGNTGSGLGLAFRF